MVKWLAGACISICGAMALCLLFLPLHLTLRISSFESEREVLCARMSEGEEFVLSYVHSVNRRPVYDTLRVEGDHLVIVRSRYDSFGAGMPEASADETPLRLDNEGWLVCTVNRPVPEVTLFVGRTANHSLRLRGREILLADLVRPGEAIRIRPGKGSYLDLLKGGCIE
jgi:hypothetical protein